MDNVIECLKERGLVDALTSEELIKRVGSPIKLYCGFDPTADSLHVGNLVGIVVLRWFQKFGHIPIVLLADQIKKDFQQRTKVEGNEMMTKLKKMVTKT